MSSFTLDFSKFVNKTEKKLETIIKKSFIGLTTDIIKGTPVRTGRLSLSWYPAVNKYSSEVASENTKSTKEDAVSKKTNEILDEMNKFKFGDMLTLSNNLPYAYDIEFNSKSGQAPQGMVRLNIMRWKKILEKSAKETK